MTAERLREAAEVLRERATEAPGGAWVYSEGTRGLPEDGPTFVRVTSQASGHPVMEGEYDRHDGQAAIYMATVHPGVGLALAKWLQDIAAGWAWDEEEPGVTDYDGWPITLEDSLDSHALAVADAILGGQS